MIELKRLYEIFKKLSPEEFEVIRKKIYSDSYKGDKSLSSKKIFDILILKPENSAIQISEIYYGKVNLTALKKLLQRLTDKILEILAERESLINNKLYDARGKAVFNIRRKLLYYDILAVHGVTNYALMILNQVINSAKLIEYYDYLIIALEKKLIKMSLANGESSFRNVYSEIKHYSDCNYSLKNCNYLFRLYASSFEYKRKNYNEEEWLLTINGIKNDFKRTKSKSIQIYIYLFEGIYYYNKGMFLKCKNKFELLYNYLIKNPSVSYDSYSINCLLNIAGLETTLWNFEKSLLSLNKIINLFSRNEFNEKLINEMIFINYFYMGDLKNSLDKILITLNMKLNENISSFLIAKRNFYLATIYTLQGLYTESNKILNNCRQLDKDKDGWNIGVRILSIINNIELDKLIIAENQIENLRKHISRIKSEGILLNRFSRISNILIYLMNNSFNFKIVSIKYRNSLNELVNNPKYGWVLHSPELLIFHEWFDAKVKGMVYDHQEVMKRLKKNNKVRA